MKLGYIRAEDVLRKYGQEEAEKILEGLERAEVIELGREYWIDRFDIKTRAWRSEDGEALAESFVIERHE